LAEIPSSTTLVGGLPVHRIGFGAMRITGLGSWGDPPDREAARNVLREAIRIGVDFVDTADSYGPGVSEEIIAEALHPYPEGLVLGTKAGFVQEGPFRARADASPQHLRAACEASLRRLRLDAIPLYYLHAVDPDVPLEESVGALSELQREGKILNIGLSNIEREELERARGIASIAAVQNRYNLAERQDEELLRACDRAGIAFVSWFPLLKGGLAKRRNAAMKKIAAAHEATPAQIALAWLLHRSPSLVAIPGSTALAHVRENVAAARIELSPAELEQLERFRGPWRVPQPVRNMAKRVVKYIPRGR